MVVNTWTAERMDKFSLGIMEAGRLWQDILQCWKNNRPVNLPRHPAKTSFKKDGNIMIFPDRKNIEINLSPGDFHSMKWRKKFFRLEWRMMPNGT